jgi:putative ABC transport system substrate-binding protein
VEPVPDAFRPCRPDFSFAERRTRAVLACTALLAFPLAGDAARLLVVQGSDSPRLERTLAALRERSPLSVDVLPLSAGGDDALRSEWSRSDRGSVLVALGPNASDAVLRLSLPGPAVHCLAGADALRAGAPSVPSEVPVDQQAAWLAKLLPSARTVALLYDPAHNTRRAEAQGAALAVAGYRTLLQPVASAAALPAALEALVGRADVLLAQPDATIYTRESSRGLMLFSFRKRIPIVGPTHAWVKLGALYALDWDYDEVGAACAALAGREVQAKGPAPVAPRPRVYVNLKSASQFGIAWNAELLKQVDLRHE